MPAKLDLVRSWTRRIVKESDYPWDSPASQLTKYGVTELEVVALIFDLEHFKVYLLGNSVTVFTDHQALVNLMCNI